MDEMAKFPGLRQRGSGGIYSFRNRVPLDLVGRIGRRDIWISLRTNDFAVAKLRYLAKALELENVFAEHRRRRDMLTVGGAVRSSDAVEAVSREMALALSRKLVAEAFGRPQVNETPNDFDRERMDDLAAQIDDDILDLQTFNENGQLRVTQVAHRLLQQHRPSASVDGLGASLREYVRRALIVIAQQERSRVNGDFAGQISDVDFQNLGPDDVTDTFVPVACINVRDASAIFWQQRIDPEITSQKTERKYRAALGQIVTFLGAETELGAIKRPDCTRFRDLRARLPSNFTKRVGVGRSLEDAVELADGKNWPRMAFETQVTYLNMMLRFLTWASDEDYIQSIKLNNIKPLVKRTPSAEKRGSFKAYHLAAIFNAPIYTGCIDDEYRFSRPGPNIIRRSRFWVPLVALFTGMRLGEVLQLTVDHIKVSEAGTKFFLLSSDMTLKNEQSRREVPMHSSLTSFGFLEFVDKKRATGKRELFDDVPFASDGTRSTL